MSPSPGVALCRRRQWLAASGGVDCAYCKIHIMVHDHPTAMALDGQAGSSLSHAGCGGGRRRKRKKLICRSHRSLATRRPARHRDTQQQEQQAEISRRSSTSRRRTCSAIDCILDDGSGCKQPSRATSRPAVGTLICSAACATGRSEHAACIPPVYQPAAGHSDWR